MSSRARREVLGRAMLDPVFQDDLITNPDQALASYDLSDRERQSFQGLTSEIFTRLTSEVGSRILHVEKEDIIALLSGANARDS